MYPDCRRERHDIPLIVETCVEEVERRGKYIYKPLNSSAVM